MSEVFRKSTGATTKYDAPANPQVLNLIPQRSLTVLDIGCGTGKLAEILKKRDCVVDGVTSSKSEFEVAEERCRRVWLHNLEAGLPVTNERYQVIVLSHVLEHLVFPDRLMSDLRGALCEEGIVVCAVPNMLFLYNRVKLFMGRVEYTEAGLMDYTHVRWYTQESLTTLFNSYGFEVQDIRYSGNLPLGPSRKILSPNLQKKIDRIGLQLFPGLFAWEFVYGFKQSSP